MNKNNKKAFLIAGGIIGGTILILLIIMIISSTATSSDSDLDNYTTSTPNDTLNSSNESLNSNNTPVSGHLSEEDYSTWYTKADSSSDMYNLYLQADSIIPPAKYKEFHEHYVKSYYYYYKMMEAEENGDDASFNTYNDLESQEESAYGELAQKLQLDLT